MSKWRLGLPNRKGWYIFAYKSSIESKYAITNEVYFSTVDQLHILVFPIRVDDIVAYRHKLTFTEQTLKMLRKKSGNSN